MKTSENSNSMEKNSLKPKPPSYLKNIDPKKVKITSITPKNNINNLIFNKNLSENSSSKILMSNSSSNNKKFISKYDNGYNEYKKVLKNLNKKIIIPIQNEIKKRNENSNRLKNNVNHLENNLKNINKELEQSKSTKNKLNTKNQINQTEIQRIKNENFYMEKEINEINEIKEKILEKINELDIEKTKFNNESENIKNNIENMKVDIKRLNKKIMNIRNDNKIKKSAFLLVCEKRDELKRMFVNKKEKQEKIKNNMNKLLERFNIKDLENYVTEQKEKDTEIDEI